MEKKLRHSHQRDLIYNYLLGTKEHPSAEMIYDDLRKVEPNLSLGTVYRNLKLLEELGMVRKVTNVNNMERYDAFPEDHIHFVCDKCGCVIDLPNIDKEQIREKLSESVLGRIEWVNIVVGGVCDECAQKDKN